ncbi:unnamed protein product [Merluccius merluccius]
MGNPHQTVFCGPHHTLPRERDTSGDAQSLIMTYYSWPYGLNSVRDKCPPLPIHDDIFPQYGRKSCTAWKIPGTDPNFGGCTPLPGLCTNDSVPLPGYGRGED